MSELLTEVDAYFSGNLSPEEKLRFEQRIKTDQSLAEDVAIYIASRSELRAELLANKTKEWQAEDEADKVEKDIPKVIIFRKSDWKKWVTGIAASLLVVFAAMYFFETKNTANKLADNFIKEHYAQFSHTMDGSKDSMQTGISLYNDKKYKEAIVYFRQFYIAHPDSNEAKKYEGLSYLKIGSYEEAIQSFSDLAAIKGLYSNPGHFLQAVALIKRNKPGDRAQAKQLLATVKSNNEEYSTEADEWLQQLE